MKTILLTWWTGFLWSHIIEDLRKNYHIIAIKRSKSNTAKIHTFLSDIKTIDLDVDDLEWVFMNNQIDAIIHTATHYGRDYRFLSDIIDSNLYLPIRLIDLGLKYGVKVFMNTDTFWDENIELPIGLKYYTLTKKDLLKYAHIAIKDSKTMRFFNLKIEHLYGPRDDNKKFLPYLISSFMGDVSSIALTLWEQKRDFIYVKDAVTAYEYILTHIDSSDQQIEDYDIWTGRTYAIRDIVERLQKLTGSKTELLFGALEYRKWEVMEAKADITKLTEFGWESKYTLDEWLIQTISSMKL